MTTQQWRHLPVAARPIAAGAEAAVAAVRDGDEEALSSAVTALAALDPAQVGLVLGTTVRLLLEDRHPDGLTGDEVRAVLIGTVRGGADPEVALVLLAGALGLDHEPEKAPAPTALAHDAAVLLAGQLDTDQIRPWLERAISEIERTQLND